MSQKEEGEQAEPAREAKAERTVTARCPKCGEVRTSSHGTPSGFIFTCIPCGVQWKVH